MSKLTDDLGKYLKIYNPYLFTQYGGVGCGLGIAQKERSGGVICLLMEYMESG